MTDMSKTTLADDEQAEIGVLLTDHYPQQLARKVVRLRAALKSIIEVWERDDDSRMRHRGDEMVDVAREALSQ